MKFTCSPNVVPFHLPYVFILHTTSPAAFLLFLVWIKTRWLPCDLMTLLKDNEPYFPRLTVFFL